MNRDQKAAVIDEVAAQISESEADLRGRLPRHLRAAGSRAARAPARRRRDVPHRQEHARPSAPPTRPAPTALKELLEGPTAHDVRARRRRRGRQGAARLPPRHRQLLEFKGGWMNGAALSRRRDRRDRPAARAARCCTAGSSAWSPSPLTGLATRAERPDRRPGAPAAADRRPGPRGRRRPRARRQSRRGRLRPPRTAAGRRGRLPPPRRHFQTENQED